MLPSFLNGVTTATPVPVKGLFGEDFFAVIGAKLRGFNHDATSSYQRVWIISTEDILNIHPGKSYEHLMIRDVPYTPDNR